MGYVLGVDLGTTFSAAAIGRDHQVEMAMLGNRAAVLPSVVYLEADGTTTIGEPAERRGRDDPTRVAREFKRRVGDPTPLLVGGAPISADVLVGRLYGAIVEAVASREGAWPDHVVVTHPANWGPFKTDLLEQAARRASYPPVSLLAEPVAAATSYAAAERVAPGTVVAVYDLGGGTFDATVLVKTDDGFAVRGQPEGIERLGGIDIDQAVLAFADRSLGGAIGALDPEDPDALGAAARIRRECVEAKEALSDDTEVTITVSLPERTERVRLTRHELEEMVRPSLLETIHCLRRAIHGAGLSSDQVDRVLLVGGVSRMPLVAELVGAELGRPVAVDAHPKHAVALGAARSRLDVPAADVPAADVPAASTPPAASAPPAAPTPAPPPAPTTPRPEPAPRRSRRGLVTAIVAAVLVVGGLAAWLVVSNSAASNDGPLELVSFTLDDTSGICEATWDFTGTPFAATDELWLLWRGQPAAKGAATMSGTQSGSTTVRFDELAWVSNGAVTQRWQPAGRC